ncbi:MAG: DUF1800 domain-containing protein [Bacteroidota bacterium]
MQSTSLLTTTALDPFIPSAQNPWDAEKVRHRYNRMAHGASPAEIAAGIDLGPDALIDDIISQIINAPYPDPPTWADWTWSNYGGNFDLFFTHKYEMYIRLMQRQLDSPFRSKLWMFWHNHFVAEEEVYSCNNYMWSYFELIRNNLLGNFRNLVEEMGKNPAMLVYLNGNLNIAQEPNENYARELMELFTMGENNGYTQDDIVEVARALTGWQCDMYACTLPYFLPIYHDSTFKTIFGQTGNWGYQDVHNLIFTQRKNQVAEYICTKIYTYFVNPTPNQEVIDAMAAIFIEDWELEPVFTALLKSAHFYEANQRNTKIKSPTEFFFSLANSTGLQFPVSINNEWLGDIFYFTGELGQNVLNPVDVAGWPGQRSWVNETTLTLRWSAIGGMLFFRMANNNFTRGELVNLAIALNNDQENDPEVITQSLIQHFLNTDLEDNLFQSAVAYFKADVPQNYFEDGSWNLYYDDVPDQIISLLYFLTRLPEWQLC